MPEQKYERAKGMPEQKDPPVLSKPPFAHLRSRLPRASCRPAAGGAMPPVDEATRAEVARRARGQQPVAHIAKALSALSGAPRRVRAPC